MGEVFEVRPQEREVASIMEWLQRYHPDAVPVAVAARVDGRLLDLTAALPGESKVEVLSFADEAGREVHRHTASHVMAQAVQEIFPDARLAIGPAIEEGYYYDFDTHTTFQPEDLARIEKRMREIVARDLPLRRQELTRPEAIALFKARNEKYKVELIEGLPESEAISLYHQGDFVDFCRGPHLPSTGWLKAFKLLSVAGAYWRGDERNPMLQRIYGTAFPDQAQLDEFVRLREEAEKRDHRRLGRELDLYSTPEQLGGGLVLWHPKGALVRYLIEEFWRKEHFKRGYHLVFSPHIARAHLWETSGHLQFYRDGMYGPIMIDEDEYRLKPMNCPFHVLIYKSKVRSYRDLPIRYCELGTVYRYERSGVLHGLLRVRGFTQDDAHLICTPEQIGDEVKGVLDFTIFMMNAFGYHDFAAALSVRDESDASKYMGTDEDWQIAERSLTEALESRGMAYRREPGEAVFYGPKIDIKVRDSLGRLWQCTTIQFDFNMPEGFNMTYTGEDGKEHRPYMVHRALLGSLERFFGILIEHYAGNFPLWLAPVQLMVMNITDAQADYAKLIAERLQRLGFRVKLNLGGEKVGAKIRDAEMEKIPYMAIVGAKEAESGLISLRQHGQGDIGQMTVEALAERLKQEVENKK